MIYLPVMVPNEAKNLPNLNSLNKKALHAAMRGGTHGWGMVASSSINIRYSEFQNSRGRKKCSCGCGSRATHRGMANGVCLMVGCEIYVARWVRDGITLSAQALKR